jgi:hypothetical protein
MTNVLCIYYNTQSRWFYLACATTDMTIPTMYSSNLRCLSDVDAHTTWSVCVPCVPYASFIVLLLLVQDEYEFQMLQVCSPPTPLKFPLGASHANLHHRSSSMPSEFLLSGPFYGYIVTYKSGRISGAQKYVLSGYWPNGYKHLRQRKQPVTSTWDNGNNPTTTNSHGRLLSRKYQTRRMTAVSASYNHIHMMELAISDDTSGNLFLVICSQNQ